METDNARSTGSQTDGRRARGDRTRREVVTRAAEVASEIGLSAVSLNQIARDLGISKSGVAAAFGTKEELEVATVHAANDIFIEHVVAPAMAKRPGRRRLQALVDSWISYVEVRVFPGGCFMSSVVHEYDTKPGPVRDVLWEGRAAWLDLLAQQVSLMQDEGELDDALTPQDIAFEISAVLAAANSDRNLSGSTKPLRQARRVLRARLAI